IKNIFCIVYTFFGSFYIIRTAGPIIRTAKKFKFYLHITELSSSLILCLLCLFFQSSKNDFRRKWDKDEYEHLAQKRLAEERDRERRDGKTVPPVKRDLLRHRDYKVDLESKLGKTIVITKTTPQAEMGGYYCNVCDCVVKDSINFLDHINGKKHQRNLGMSMRVERSSLDQVKKRFEVNKKKLEEKQKEYDFEERMKELREEEEKAKAYKKEKQKERKRRAEGDMDFEEDDEMAAVMGFSGFGSSKKSH
uniref:Zinc finger matrin-type protein 2 n=1 Tax=Monopterus albus TaxID=43700 RepID=A0A3Q3JI38_MONAL